MTKLTDTQTVILNRANVAGFVVEYNPAKFKTDAAGYARSITALVKRELLVASGRAVAGDYSYKGLRLVPADSASDAICEDDTVVATEEVKEAQEVVPAITIADDVVSATETPKEARHRAPRAKAPAGPAPEGTFEGWLGTPNLDELRIIAARNGIHWDVYVSLHPGLQAMNMRNRLRNLWKRGLAK